MRNFCITLVFINIYNDCNIFMRKGVEMARILISMPEDFLNKIDLVADDENRSRSELIREALRVYIQKQQKASLSNAQRDADLLESLM